MNVWGEEEYDVVAMDIKTKKIISKSVWREITDKQRLKRLLVREQKIWENDKDIKVVAILAGRASIGDIISNE